MTNTVGRDEHSYRTLAVMLLRREVNKIAQENLKTALRHKSAGGKPSEDEVADRLGSAIFSAMHMVRAVEWLQSLPRELCPETDIDLGFKEGDDVVEFLDAFVSDLERSTLGAATERDL